MRKNKNNINTVCLMLLNVHILLINYESRPSTTKFQKQFYQLWTNDKIIKTTKNNYKQLNI